MIRREKLLEMLEILASAPGPEPGREEEKSASASEDGDREDELRLSSCWAAAASA